MPRVALTFDDGPGPATDELLDVLAERGAHATFFLLGCNLERARATAVRLAREGHLLGNHTYSHARPRAQSSRALAEEITRTDELLRAIHAEAGVAARAPIPIRLPYGPALADPRLNVLAALGRTHVHWTADFQDWVEPPPDPAELAQRMRAHVLAQEQDGLAAVIDLHDSSRQFADRSATVRAVRLLLKGDPLTHFTVPL
jgi:chitin deacetylase